jgi:hypothetical protein
MDDVASNLIAEDAKEVEQKTIVDHEHFPCYCFCLECICP